jgi:hypothetical protein
MMFLVVCGGAAGDASGQAFGLLALTSIEC